ncbi:MAG TPA: LytTR family DNA-binding domain-containing protein [Opitutaceae bacterium]
MKDSRYRALIADHESSGRDGLLAALKADPEVEVVAACSDGAAVQEGLTLLAPEIAFLEMAMPGCDTLALLRAIPAAKRPVSVLVSHRDVHAAAAFDVSAIDFLLKPLQEPRLRTAVERAKVAATGRRLAASAGHPAMSGRLAFKVARGHVIVDQRDIVWVEAAGDGVRVGEGHEIHSVRETLQSVERRLESGLFMRMHRSFLVNPARVRRVTPLLYGEHELLMSDGVKIRVGRSFRDQLKMLLGPAKR